MTLIDKFGALKSKHLAEARRDAERDLEDEQHPVDRLTGDPVPVRGDVVARIEQRIADIDAELARRGMAADGFTILDQAAYEAWSAEAEAMKAPVFMTFERRRPHAELADLLLRLGIAKPPPPPSRSTRIIRFDPLDGSSAQEDRPGEDPCG